MSFFISLLVAVASITLQGITLSCNWTWFVVPVFDMPELSVAVAAGIATMVRGVVLSSGIMKKGDIDDVDHTAMWIMSILMPLVSLGLGWVISLFI